MKAFIAFCIGTLSIAIPTKRSWTEERYNKEIKPLQEAAQHNGIEKIVDEFITTIYNSTFAEKQQFQKEILKMDFAEKMWLEKNLEFIFNGNIDFDINGSNENDTDAYYTEGSYSDDSYNDSYYQDFESYYDDDYNIYQDNVNLNDSYDAVQWALNTVQNKANDLFHHMRTKIWKNLKNDDFEALAPMTISERLRIRDSEDIRLSEALYGIMLLAILMIVMVFIFSITICRMKKKEKFDDEKNPILSSKPKIKIEKNSCLKAKADVQEIKVGEYTVLCYKD